MRKLFEIDAEIDELLELSCGEPMADGSIINKVTGEVISASDITASLEALQVERSKKIEGVCLSILNDKAELEAVKKQIKIFQQRAKAIETHIEGKSEWVKVALGGENHKDADGRFSVSYRRSKAVNITDETCIPQEYKEPQPDRIKKSDILAALKAGAVISGAELEERSSVTIK